MNEEPHISETLIQEIARYLAAVELFRAERCEPKWRPEPAWMLPACAWHADAREAGVSGHTLPAELNGT